MVMGKQMIKKGLEQSSEQAMEVAATAAVVEQNPLKVLVRELEGELNSNFFLGNYANSVGRQQHFIAKKKIKEHRSSSKKRYSPKRVKSRNFLTNTSYNRLKREDYNNASFAIDCFTFLLFNLNVFFLMVCVKMLWTYLIPSEFYFFIC